ncbi:MAG TPA: flagellar hook capping FlgD N-terminal domain-containing protein [Pirellulales bacterium]|nr:flagellar hook capping FlgD N-terminal domain-containing protein [Pirellulales bacterium]
MSTTTGASGASSSTGANSTTSSTDKLTSITPDDFLQLLITQLKNQDPLNPTSSDQILQQISLIDNIEATTNLSSSLNSVATDQGFQAASGLIGMQVQGVDSNGNPVSGTVDSASFSNGVASLNVGSQTMPLSGISAIGGQGTSTPTSGG